MDEYLLLVMAKLKADRLKLEREGRERQWLRAEPLARSRSDVACASRGAKGHFSGFEWREQS